MLSVKAILNVLHRQPGFVYGTVKLLGEGEARRIEVRLRRRKRRRPRCSVCGTPGAGNGWEGVRRFRFVPLWGIPVFFVYARQRVLCPVHGSRVEAIPWAEGKQQMCSAFLWFLAHWTKRLTWSETARLFRVGWDTVFRAAEMAVEWGRAHQSLEDVRSIGVDEIKWKVGHKFLTLVYQIDEGSRRLLWIGQERSRKTLLRFFKWFTPERTARIQFVCSDMWQAYLTVIKRKAPRALHILDRFHIMARINKGIEETRRQEVRRLRAEGAEPILTRMRWILLKRPANLTMKQGVRLRELLQANLRCVRAYLLREEFQRFWKYKSRLHAARFFNDWARKAMRSKIEPIKSAVRTLRRHSPLILNWFAAKGAISSGSVEGMNCKAKVVIRSAFGFKGFRTIQVALYQTLGKLPEHELAHRFC